MLYQVHCLQRSFDGFGTLDRIRAQYARVNCPANRPTYASWLAGTPFALVQMARLAIARQMLTDAQMRFATNLSFNPWHCLPEHRPLGNQNRAGRRLYEELSRFRQQMNGWPHVEPAGEEVFS